MTALPPALPLARTEHVLTGRELSFPGLVADALLLKERPDDYADALERKGLLVLMQKTSTRTTLSFAAAIAQLGGYAIKLDWAESNFGITPLRYEARYVSSACDVVLARMKEHADLVELARHSSVPVMNGCCNRYHPSQALADVLTISEALGGLEGVVLTYVGVHNNVANSLVTACTRVGVEVRLVTPLANEAAWDEELMAEARATGLVSEWDSLAEAAAGSDVVYTDTWVDMEFFHDPAYAVERDRRIRLMAPFGVTRENLGGARPYVMHCMPVHPGFEIADELVDGPRSLVFRQAENRLHAAKALLLHLLGVPVP